MHKNDLSIKQNGLLEKIGRYDNENQCEILDTLDAMDCPVRWLLPDVCLLPGSSIWVTSV